MLRQLEGHKASFLAKQQRMGHSHAVLGKQSLLCVSGWLPAKGQPGAALSITIYTWGLYMPSYVYENLGSHIYLSLP